MNAHRTLGLVAAIVVTASQVLLFAVDTAAVAQTASLRGGYANPLPDAYTPGSDAARGASARTVVG